MSTTLGVNVDVVMGATTVRGQVWTSSPTIPHTEDVSSDRTTYIVRNESKTRTVDAFMGVRYGNAERFSSPVSYALPSGVYDAQTWPNVPYQSYISEYGTDGRPEWGLESGAYNWAGYPNEVREVENPLTLNIFAPSGRTGSLPVVVMFHGGGFTVNSAIAYQSLGHRLATKGVIVVLVEYRGGIFGWNYNPEWALEGSWEGPDFAFQDQKMGLKWVYDNIATFGGDATNITIAGTSAGGASVLGFYEDSTTWSWWNRGLCSSGGGIGQRWKAEASERNKGYVEQSASEERALTTLSDSLEDWLDPSQTFGDAIAATSYGAALRDNLSPENVLSLRGAGNRYKSIRVGSTATTYTASQNLYPFQDGSTLTHETALDAFKADDVANKTLWILTAGNEANLIGYNTTTDDPNRNAYSWAKNLGYSGEKELFDTPFMTGEFFSDRERVRRTYNDGVFGAAAYLIARQHTLNGNTAYLELFNYKSPGNGSSYANHSTDIIYSFGNVEWGSGVSDGVARVYTQDIFFADGRMQLVANFAKNGNPNTAYNYVDDYDLFASSADFSMVAYNDTDHNWNVSGKFSEFNATNSTAIVENRIGFRQDALANYEERIG